MFSFFLFSFVAFMSLTSLLGQPSAQQHVQGTLIAPTTSIQADRPFTLGLLLDHAPNWHTYWQYPGDSGIPTSIELELPAGFQVGAFQWPAPKTYIQSGLVNHVYDKQVLLMFSVTPSPNWQAGPTLNITGKAEWLECDDAICVPGGTDLTLTLKVSKDTPTPGEHATLFASTQAALPSTDTGQLTIKAYRHKQQRYLTIEAAPDTQLPPAQSVRFYSADGQIVNRAEEIITPYGDNGYGLTFEYDEFTESSGRSLPGVLVAEPGWPTGLGDTPNLKHALAIDPVFIEGLPPLDLGDPTSFAKTHPITATPAPSFLPLLAFGFLGGLILNMMPCVFPVLGIKILGFVHQAGEARSKVMLHGLTFTLGVLISFWILTGLLLFLRAGGNQLGWGFQLQSPEFVTVLSILLLVFALNLSGVFEIGQSLVGTGSQLTQKQGFSGTFFSGVLATIVATPCAAPFLAPALGAGLTLPATQSIAIFTSIALGLSSPYLIMSAFPQLANMLPKPGAWMETFKQLMAFPLYATVGFLVWTYAGLVEDENRLLFLLLGLVSIALSTWLYGRFVSNPVVSKHKSIIGIALTGLCLIGGGWLSFYQPKELSWEPWSPERVAELQAQQQPFYIDFTARWCLTCKVNKGIVFGSEEVISAFRKHDVILLKADWTQQDETITQALAEYNRSAVPFNLMFGPGVDAPVVLPEVLTPGIVLEHLDRVMGK